MCECVGKAGGSVQGVRPIESRGFVAYVLVLSPGHDLRSSVDVSRKKTPVPKHTPIDEKRAVVAADESTRSIKARSTRERTTQADTSNLSNTQEVHVKSRVLNKQTTWLILPVAYACLKD